MVDAEEDERWGEDFRGDELARGVATQGEAPGGDPGSQSAFGGGATRARDDERGREPGRDRNPRGGRPYKRAYGRARAEGAEQFHRSREPDHEDQQRGDSSSATTRRWRSMGSTRSSSRLGWGHRPATRVSWWGCSTRSTRRLGSSLRWYWPMRATATSRIYWRLEDRGIDAHVALGREGKSQVAVDPARLPATHRMGEKLASPAGKARYAQRKWLSEAPNGWIKEVLGFRRFSLRGLAKVRGEWDLVCLALNIKRMGTVATC